MDLAFKPQPQWQKRQGNERADVKPVVPAEAAASQGEKSDPPYGQEERDAPPTEVNDLAQDHDPAAQQ